MKAAVRTYFERHPSSTMKVGVNVRPDEDVLQFAPYLLKQNIMSSVEELCQDTPINYIVVNMSPI